ncbi:DUF4185 domain-containing protein [Mycobacterium sp.]|uniref:DUF4185 domain-containing protein n=1 Tax=Mycobacterium sp. TaxID=1785 RepID=UPI003F9E6846
MAVTRAMEASRGGDAVNPGQVRKIGSVAGTGSDPGIPGIGAADLGEIVNLPDERMVAIFGDSFSGNNVGVGEHYRSVAVEVTGFEAQGRPRYGKVLNGPIGSRRELFRMPKEAKKIPGVVDTLPAGTITTSKNTYVMVVGTDPHLRPVGGSWLTEVTDHPARGWKPVARSWRAWEPANPLGGAPTQLSGYQGSDGTVYIAADSFDRGRHVRFHGVTLYRVHPATVTDRSCWQPWTGAGWGAPGAAPAPLSPSDFGELSFAEIDGHAVLSGFNQASGCVEVRVAAGPTEIFTSSPTVIAHQHPGHQHTHNFVFHNYGGFIVPGSTLDKLAILVSKWGHGDYNTQLFLANVAPVGRVTVVSPREGVT